MKVCDVCKKTRTPAVKTWIVEINKEMRTFDLCKKHYNNLNKLAIDMLVPEESE